MEYINGVDLMTYVSTPLDQISDEDSREAVGSIEAKAGASETVASWNPGIGAGSSARERNARGDDAASSKSSRRILNLIS